MSAAAIETASLTKVFRPRASFFRSAAPKTAVDAVTFAVRDGELFVLLGKNGAGKTTLVKMLATLVLPTSGSARVFGRDVDVKDGEVRKLIGLASPDERSFFWRLTGRQNLEFFGALHGLRGRSLRRRIDELCARLEIAEFADRRFDGYSSGMKQRVALARSLLGSPRLLFLDEPTRSLDPAAQKQTRALIHSLSREGLTVVLVTHQLDEARELAHRIGFMDAGRLRVLERDAVDLDALF